MKDLLSKKGIQPTQYFKPQEESIKQNNINSHKTEKLDARRKDNPRNIQEGVKIDIETSNLLFEIMNEFNLKSKSEALYLLTSTHPLLIEKKYSLFLENNNNHKEVINRKKYKALFRDIIQDDNAKEIERKKRLRSK